MNTRNKKSIPTKVANAMSGRPTKVPVLKVTAPKINASKRRSGASRQGSIEEDAIRFKAIWIAMGLVFVAIFGRLAYIQVINKSYYQGKGNSLITTVKKEPSYRGMITDRNNMPLAISAPLTSAYFSPHDYALEYYELKARQQDLQ